MSTLRVEDNAKSMKGKRIFCFAWIIIFFLSGYIPTNIFAMETEEKKCDLIDIKENNIENSEDNLITLPLEEDKILNSDMNQAIEQDSSNIEEKDNQEEVKETEEANSEQPDYKEEIQENNTDSIETNKETNTEKTEENTKEITPNIDINYPKSYDFKVDPFNSLGNGQIFSDDFIFENNGNVDVIVTIEKILYEFPNNEDFRCLTEEYTEENDIGLKDVYMYMKNVSEVPETGDILVADFEQLNPISFTLSADKTAENNIQKFQFSGSISPLPDKAWQDKDIRVRVYFNIEPIGLDKEEKEKENINDLENDNTQLEQTDIEKEELKPEIIEPNDNTEEQQKEDVEEDLNVEQGEDFVDKSEDTSLEDITLGENIQKPEEQEKDLNVEKKKENNSQNKHQDIPPIISEQMQKDNLKLDQLHNNLTHNISKETSTGSAILAEEQIENKNNIVYDTITQNSDINEQYISNIIEHSEYNHFGILIWDYIENEINTFIISKEENTNQSINNMQKEKEETTVQLNAKSTTSIEEGKINDTIEQSIKYNSFWTKETILKDALENNDKLTTMIIHKKYNEKKTFEPEEIIWLDDLEKNIKVKTNLLTYNLNTNEEDFKKLQELSLKKDVILFLTGFEEEDDTLYLDNISN